MNDSIKRNGDKVCIAEIATAHGVKGQARLRCFADNADLLTNPGGLTDAKGNFYKIRNLNRHKDMFIATIDGLTDRDQVEALRGTELFIDRDTLPDIDDDEIYHIDLIGLDVCDQNKGDIGVVMAVQNFGAGDLLEVKRPDMELVYLPFNPQTVIQVDTNDDTIMLNLPPGLLEMYDS